MSRSRIFASFSSSRQMMIAWKVSGLSQRPVDHRLAAGLDALGDGDFAFARQKLHLPHLAQIHAHRIVGAVGGEFSRASTLIGRFSLAFLVFLHLDNDVLGFLLALDDVDSHFREHRHEVFDLLGVGLVRGQHRVDLVKRDVAARLGELDQPLDAGIG